MPEILVVDDDRAARTAVSMRLSHAGYQTSEAGSGRAAVEQFEAHQPRVVILDASMPDMSGFDVCRYIRANDPQRNTKVIFVSGASTPSPDYVERCVDACDADGYFRKPYDINQLVSVVEEAVAPARLAEAI